MSKSSEAENTIYSELVPKGGGSLVKLTQHKAAPRIQPLTENCELSERHFHVLWVKIE